jgi:hypothetical protein
MRLTGYGCLRECGFKRGDFVGLATGAGVAWSVPGARKASEAEAGLGWPASRAEVAPRAGRRGQRVLAARIARPMTRAPS